MGSIYLVTSGSLLVYLAATWVVGKTLGLSSSEFYVLWGLLAAIGTLGAAGLVWWKMRQKSEEAETDEDQAQSEPAGNEEIDLLIRDADTKLASARQARIGNLPLIFILGDQGATKTSVVMNSGLEPELLAGQVYQDNAVAPTRTANFWYAGNAVLAEVNSRVLADSNRWSRVVRRLRPGSLKSVVGGNAQAPRAALVCVNAEIFTQPGAAETLATL